MLKYNKSKSPFITESKNIIKPTIYPGMIVEDSCYPPFPDEMFAYFDSNRWYGQKLVSFQRNYALGDLLMLIPVLRHFKEYYKVETIQLFTFPGYAATLKPIFKDIKILTNELLTVIPTGLCYDLNSILEKDHSLDNKEKQLHRCHIYAKALDIPALNTYDWSTTLPNKEFNFPTKRKKIGIQIRGSGYIKTIPFKQLCKLVDELVKDYHVVLIDHEQYPQFKHPEITNLTGKLSVPECIQMLRNLDTCITMDSGVLWMCHVANCPVITVLGATREEERVSLHPSYPDKAKTISLSKMIGCEPCFETKCNCGNRIDCMNKFDFDIFLAEVKNKLTEIFTGIPAPPMPIKPIERQEIKKIIPRRRV